MTSPRRHYANRQNASLSRGPRTEKGKARSSQNALKHGLTARHALLAGEDPHEYRRLRTGLIAEFSPQGTLEGELVERIAVTFWRLRRVAPFEAALMASIQDDPTNDGGVPAKVLLGRNVEEFLRMDFSGKLIKYETNLQRLLSALLTQLSALQQQRAKSGDAALSDTETARDQAFFAPGHGILRSSRLRRLNYYASQSLVPNAGKHHGKKTRQPNRRRPHREN